MTIVLCVSSECGVAVGADSLGVVYTWRDGVTTGVSTNADRDKTFSVEGWLIGAVCGVAGLNEYIVRDMQRRPPSPAADCRRPILDATHLFFTEQGIPPHEAFPISVLFASRIGPPAVGLIDVQQPSSAMPRTLTEAWGILEGERWCWRGDKQAGGAIEKAISTRHWRGVALDQLSMLVRELILEGIGACAHYERDPTQKTCGGAPKVRAVSRYDGPDTLL